MPEPARYGKLARVGPGPAPHLPFLAPTRAEVGPSPELAVSKERESPGLGAGPRGGDRRAPRAMLTLTRAAGAPRPFPGSAPSPAAVPWQRGGSLAAVPWQRSRPRGRSPAPRRTQTESAAAEPDGHFRSPRVPPRGRHFQQQQRTSELPGQESGRRRARAPCRGSFPGPVRPSPPPGPRSLSRPARPSHAGGPGSSRRRLPRSWHR